MKKTKILLCFAIVIFSFQNGNCQTKKTAIAKQSFDGFIKSNFKKSIRFQKDLVGVFCSSEVYFVQGFNADSVLKERQIIIKKKGVFTKSNRFFYYCDNLAMVHYKHENPLNETQKDLQNLLISYDSGGKFFIKDAAMLEVEKQAIKNEEHIGPTGQYVSFQEYVEEKKCKKF
jgi:hypothetical protein